MSTPSLEQTLDRLTAEVLRRDAEARARLKAPPPAPQSSWHQQYLSGARRAIAMWTDVLEVKVRMTDLRLSRARYRLTHVPGSRQRPIAETAGPAEIIAQSTITLARDHQVHELTIALHGDGRVRATDRSQARGGPAARYPETDAHDLTAAYAEAVLAEFLRRKLGWGGLDSDVQRIAQKFM